MEWDWEDPDQLLPIMERFTGDLAQCDKLDPTAITPPYHRAQLLDIGVTGIEFAAWKTAHPAGLGSDVVPLRGSQRTSERGRLFHVDGERYFVELDIREPLPFETGCLDWVYAEHLIEHVPVPVAVFWLSEVHRVLAPGGLLRLTTPDLETYVDGYREGSRFFDRHRRRLQLSGVGSPMPPRRAFMFNQLFYLYGHRWIYDLAELRHVLSRAGFDPAAVRRCAFQEGARPDVATLDRLLRNDETLYAEVTKATTPG